MSSLAESGRPSLKEQLVNIPLAFGLVMMALNGYAQQGGGVAYIFAPHTRDREDARIPGCSPTDWSFPTYRHPVFYRPVLITRPRILQHCISYRHLVLFPHPSTYKTRVIILSHTLIVNKTQERGLAASSNLSALGVELANESVTGEFVHTREVIWVD